MTSPRIRVEVVHQIAAADDQHTFLAQHGKLAADLEMERGWLDLIDAELHDGCTRVGVHVTQHGPCSVIEPPRGVEPDLQWCEHLLNAAGELRIARRRVLDLIKFSREPAKIMDGSRGRANRNTGFRYEPMS